jgi:hypothetical protein
MDAYPVLALQGIRMDDLRDRQNVVTVIDEKYRLIMLPIILVAIDLIGHSPPQLTAYANTTDCLAASEKEQRAAAAREAKAAKEHNGEFFAAEKRMFFACVTRETAEQFIKDRPPQ